MVQKPKDQVNAVSSLLTQCVEIDFRVSTAITERLVVVMTSSNSPLDTSTDAVNRTELLAGDLSKKTASFSNSKTVYCNSVAIGTTQFLELENFTKSGH